MKEKKDVKITLLVSTYNWPEALSVCLNAIAKQDYLPNEVVIADDGSSEVTRRIIDEFRERGIIPVVHCWQEDEGFRKTRILNYAIAQSSGDYIIQIDGDIVINRHFVKDHVAQMRKGTFMRGSRASFTEELTQKILKSGQPNLSIFSKGVKNRFNGVRSHLLAAFLCRNSDDVRHVKGCNTAFWKDDFIRVNGYNIDLTGWGHEDIELAARLYNSGVALRIIKSLAVGYHLYHKFCSRADEEGNLSVYCRVMEEKIERCEKGYQECLQIMQEDGKVWR